MTGITDQDQTDMLVERVRDATTRRTPLRIVGGDTRGWYGRPVAAVALDLGGHAGIINYDPGELVLTVRAGTRLEDVDALLHAHGQCLPFEPPRFGASSTVGGTVAAGLAGPARVARGPLRDYVLGARLLAGDGRVLRFGGEVMKNVAGYDVARVLAGSLGVLGVLLDVSLKVLPVRPSLTLRMTCGAADALDKLARAALSGVPITASCWHRGTLYARLEGSALALREFVASLDGEIVAASLADAFWRNVRDQRHDFFSGATTLWRVNVPALTPVAQLAGADAMLFEWHGAQRWYADIEPGIAHAAARAGNGFATRFRTRLPQEEAAPEVFAPLSPPLLQLHRSLKQVFDPAGICNPGRMYAGL
jgi:glycolate oxidase FAD binding subunit